MNRYLLFRLYASLCSWGDIAVGELRPSYIHPSKSAIVGLLSAALGIRRDEDEKIRNLTSSYNVAVLVETSGKPLYDYHTAQVPPGKKRYSTRKDELLFMPRHELKTILSSRDYRMDALYTIILRENGGGLWTLEKIAEKLICPVFTLYLGRKCCPLALPFEPQIIKAETLTDAVRDTVFKCDEMGIKESILSQEHNKKHLYFEEPFLPEVTEKFEIYVRRDIPLSRNRWQFDTRKEYHAVIGG